MKILLFFALLIMPLSANLQAIKKTYGDNDLAQKPPFVGGYINFGYWEGISLKSSISKQNRLKASQNLYRLIFHILNPDSSDFILEVGCGQGLGVMEIMKRYHPKQVIGIDITPEQIERSYQKHSNFILSSPNIVFLQANGAKTPFPSSYFTKIYSVEVAQYFPSMSKFAQEAWRILKPNGMIVLTAHFATSDIGYQKLAQLLPTAAQGIDKIIPIQEVVKAFKDQGFHVYFVQSIGQHVFEGFDLWLSQVDDLPWGRNIYKAFDKGYMDYYIICAGKYFRKNEKAT